MAFGSLQLTSSSTAEMLKSEKSLAAGDLVKLPIQKILVTGVKTTSGGCTDLTLPTGSEEKVRAFISDPQSVSETAGTSGLSKLSRRHHLQVFYLWVFSSNTETFLLRVCTLVLSPTL